ncbi:hypothetical protein QBC37DRAFT_425818 [Rhypophila decipiens]|uniref:Uncharacterized protein n=1 Tax=Rhypophila decipiens TaxID=261697 RepID=A0AAN7B6N0_9PEZI|nr:hypothetical protein QBC37DRAFT_425818 [Rhypophila decipiens]
MEDFNSLTDILFTHNSAGVAHFPAEFHRTWHDESWSHFFLVRQRLINSKYFRKELFPEGIESISTAPDESFVANVVLYLLDRLPPLQADESFRPASKLPTIADLLGLLGRVLNDIDIEILEGTISVAGRVMAVKFHPASKPDGQSLRCGRRAYDLGELTVAGVLALAFVCRVVRLAEQDQKETCERNSRILENRKPKSKL